MVRTVGSFDCTALIRLRPSCRHAVATSRLLTTSRARASVRSGSNCLREWLRVSALAPAPRDRQSLWLVRPDRVERLDDREHAR